MGSNLKMCRGRLTFEWAREALREPVLGREWPTASGAATEGSSVGGFVLLDVR
jgi:hypothetical protein